MSQKLDIKSFDIDKLKDMLKDLSQPSFRANQIFDWLHKKRVYTFSEMTNLSEELRNTLDSQCFIQSLEIKKKLTSKLDGTVKYLFELSDKEYVETVLMKYKYGYSICVSSQVGCKMGCEFCASTKAGFVRNLTPSEILEQVYKAEEDMGVHISHIVVMGIGEPLDNFENVTEFLKLINSPLGANISLRNISVSTCGVVDKIIELAKLKLGITLSISLHASDDKTRSKIMPINRRYNIETLLKACDDYTEKTGRRISFEYALIKGENDSIDEAKRLVKLLKGKLCHVNLIPVNYVKEAGFEKSDKQSVILFRDTLLRYGINTTVRRTLGSDIEAACGQLRRDNLTEVK